MLLNEQLQSDPRDVASSLKSSLQKLQALPFTSSIDELYSQKVEILVKICDFSIHAYKEAQQLINQIDDRIQMEYAYFARAQNSIIRLTSEGKFNFDLCLAIDDALTASRHLLNDTIDLVVEHTAKKANALDTRSQHLSISDVYEDYDDIANLLVEINDQIAESRGVRGVLRVQSYIEIIDNGSYKKIVSFCQKLPKIDRDLKKKQRDDRRESAKVVIPILALLVSCVGVAIAFFTYNK